jgi:hypothetical protein
MGAISPPVRHSLVQLPLPLQLLQQHQREVVGFSSLLRCAVEINSKVQEISTCSCGEK